MAAIIFFIDIVSTEDDEVYLKYVTVFGLLLAGSCRADGPAFDAVSIRRNAADGTQRGGQVTGGPGTSDPSRYTATNVTMASLLFAAFGLARDEIVTPSWVNRYPPDAFYTLTATMPPTTTKKQFQGMLQNTLTERFQMAVHHEMGSRPGYNLDVDSKGPKLHSGRPDSARASSGPSVGRGPDGFRIMPPGPGIEGVSSGGTQRTKYQEISMDKFSDNLGNMIALSTNLNKGPVPRVHNRTGLPGSYTFVLEFSCPSCDELRTTSDSDLASGGEFPNIFAAIRQQLGLRLEKTDDIRLDIVVVDSIDKIPAEN